MAPRPRRAELVGLLAALLLTAAGIWLVVSASRGALWDADREIAAGRVVDLSRLDRARPLLPRLEPVVADEAERQFVADRIVSWLGAPDGSGPRRTALSGVAALGTITVTERDLPPRRRLPALRERFAERRDQLLASPAQTDIPIPLLTAAQLAALRREVVVRSPDQFHWTLLWSAALLLLPFYAAHAWLRRRRSNGDPYLLPIVMALCGIGFVMMVSLRDPLRDPLLFVRFAEGVAAGSVALAAAASLDFERWLGPRLAYLPLLGAIALSLLLIAFGSGPGASDAKVNLMGAQPVEAIRVLVLLFLAGHFAHRWRALREADRLAVVPVAAGMGLVLLFFFLQKDLGPAMVLAGVFLGLYIVARGRATAAGVGLAALVGGFGVGYLAGYPHTVAQRVRMWWSPWDNAVRGGDQIAHALWALATGAIRGTGLGLGAPQMIPAGHTDLVLSSIGEETGLVGLLVVFALFIVLAYRAFRIARQAPGDRTFFLALGLTLGVFGQLLLISAGLLDMMPLTGVTTPFLSYGRSSMLANFFAIGVLLSIGRRTGDGWTRLEFSRQTGWLRLALAAGAVLVVSRVVWVQTVGADRFVAATALAVQADGVRRFEYNPRLLAVAQQIVRGTITDRHGIPLATSRPSDLRAHAADLEALGVSPAEACPQEGARCYPFGGITYHLLGDWRTQTNWAAGNTSFIERDQDARLRGYDDHARVVEFTDPDTGATTKVIRRDLGELVPLLRHRGDPNDPAVRRILDRPRDVRLALDIRLQRQVAALLKEGVDRAGRHEGAAVVLSPEGDLLASVSYPWPAVPPRIVPGGGDTALDNTDPRYLDRARYGLYPPGSSFAVVMAAAALRTAPTIGRQKFRCERLPGGRVGKWLPGFPLPVEDDAADRVPHGRVDMARGFVVSCNAYFAQLGLRLGAPAIEETASLFDISLSRPESDATVRSLLPYEAIGQGQVLATPFKMARVVAALAADGAMPQGRWVISGSNRRTDAPRPVLPPERARLLLALMRRSVVEGTAQGVRGVVPAIAGKTGSAQVQDAAAHAWFVGFAPYEAGSGGTSEMTAAAPERIAFAVLVEHGEDGGAVAAPIAGGIVTGAKALGIIR
jgi:cell division protein FtsW (lipid II flippase)